MYVRSTVEAGERCMNMPKNITISCRHKYIALITDRERQTEPGIAWENGQLKYIFIYPYFWPHL